MRKILFLFLPLVLLSCSSSKKSQEQYVPPVHYSGKLNETEVQFLKKHYPWAAGDLLVINFRQPRNSCHFDNYVINRETRKWFRDFYAKVNLEKASNIFVFSEAERVTKHLDNKTYFEDREDFLLNKYFNRETSCFGIMVLNEAGEYLQYNGHYSEIQVSAYIEALN